MVAMLKRSIIVDPRVISFGDLLEFFPDPRSIHPDRQGNDRRTSYRSAIFYTSPSRSGCDTIADVDAPAWQGDHGASRRPSPASDYRPVVPIVRPSW